MQNLSLLLFESQKMKFIIIQIGNLYHVLKPRFMKQTFIVLCFSIVSSSILNAQVEFKPAIGVNFTDFSKDPQGGDCKSKLGYQVGGTFAFGKKLYFEPGIFFLKQSTEYTSSNSTQSDIDYNISGLRIPVTVGYKLLGDENSEVGLRAFGGASAFILTHVKDLDKDDFNSANFGVFLGAGLDISFVFVELQYQWSLTNVQAEDINMIDVGKSRTLFINAGVRLRL
jgi:hypothetical protein